MRAWRSSGPWRWSGPGRFVAGNHPDELVWKHLKADTVGRMAITDKADFHNKVRATMRQLQNDPEKIRSFYQKPSLKYAA
jgi:hypothetical protein